MTTFTSEELQDLTADLCVIAEQAGQIHRKNFEEKSFDVEYKEDDSPVTTSDYEAHHFMRKKLARLTPDIPIISEENETQPDISNAPVFWTFDPLDSTKNFVEGKQDFFVKAALIENGKPILGVINAPMLDTTYFAWRGGPAFKQEKDAPLEVLQTRQLQPGEKAVILNHDRYSLRPAFQAAVNALSARGIALDIVNSEKPGGCLDYMYVAEGIADIYINCGHAESLTGGNGMSWDYAADLIILECAGGHAEQILSGEAPCFLPPDDNMNAMIGYSCKQALKPV